jgi:tetratricopeptide (TPR) repeat protein
MKRILLAVLVLGGLVGAGFHLSRRPAEPVLPATPGTEPASPVATEAPATPAPLAPAPAKPESGRTAPTPANHPAAPAAPATQPNVDAVVLARTVDLLTSPQATHDQKQAAWKQLSGSGKLDQAISVLAQRMAADPRAPEYPSALGQAYLKKCSGMQDLREQGLLALQADKLFDAALELDPSDWEARFTKAVALTHWPASMNKGNEAIQHFQTLIQQQEEQPQQPQFADSYACLGDYYQKSGRPDYARAVWQRGASFFPNNEALLGKLTTAETAQTSTTAGGR